MDFYFLEKTLLAVGLGSLGLAFLLFAFKAALRSTLLAYLTPACALALTRNVFRLTCAVALLSLLAWIALQVLGFGGAKQHETSGTQGLSPVKLSTRSLDKKVPDRHPGAREKTAQIHLEYVEVSGLADKIMEKKINDAIKAAAGVNEPHDGTEDIAMFVKNASVKGRLLNVRIEGSHYRHGGAGALNRVRSINIDLGNGETVQFKDLFETGYPEKINALARAWFSAQSYKSDFDGVRDNQCYYFDTSTLYLCFSEYEVAPGSEGIVNVTIRRADIRGLIRSEGPLAEAP